MKDITRIHLAKTAYDIELPAKTQLAAYLKELALYAGDDDVLEDIEIRMTEILRDRGTPSGGVITPEDVAALKEQLGDPTEFAGDTPPTETVPMPPTSRQLYRSTDNALLGGVLSGIATYINAPVIAIRLAFVLALILSLGTATIVYALLWILLPPATTSAEKLQLAGKPVTLQSLKEVAQESAEKVGKSNAGHLFKNIILYGTGTFFAISAIGALVITTVGGFALFFGTDPAVLSGHSHFFWLIYPLFVLSGLLLTALFSVLAYAFFAQKATRRIGIALISITLSGVLAFSSAMGLIFLFNQEHYQRHGSPYFSSHQQMPQPQDERKLVVQPYAFNELRVEGGGEVDVTYIATSESSRHGIWLERPHTVDPNSLLRINDHTATLTLAPLATTPEEIDITIYGPALQTIHSNAHKLTYHGEGRKEKLALHIGAGEVELEGGYYGQVDAHVAPHAKLDTENALIERFSSLAK